MNPYFQSVKVEVPRGGRGPFREPTEKEMEYLQPALVEAWPDAYEAIGRRSHPQYKEAACLWLGFKRGYILAKEEAEG